MSLGDMIDASHLDWLLQAHKFDVGRRSAERANEHKGFRMLGE